MEGCGRVCCANENCASSGKLPKLTSNEAAARAITCLRDKAPLCDPLPEVKSKCEYLELESSPMVVFSALPPELRLWSENSCDPTTVRGATCKHFKYQLKGHYTDKGNVLGRLVLLNSREIDLPGADIEAGATNKF
uniref:Ubiquitin-protein ligase E3A N-terminal zinc-binding domain-containing protein n=1 Tax=Parascaris univalens TaxID=6257 RepID=A0A915B146_PARUN